MKSLFLTLVIFFFTQSFILKGQDTVMVQTFTFDDPSPEGWGAPYRGIFEFPSGEQSWEKIIMIKSLKCDSATKGDKYPCGEWDYLTHSLVYLPKDDMVEAIQLGSFVTPYGKRLKMGGAKGWKWYYDVSDYEPILKGFVDIQSGNNQELLDLKFLFIKGTPPRNVISIENVYSFGTYKYEYLADDSVLKPRKIVLNKNASGFKLKARISGHGHFGPHNCCEWDSKTHTYAVGEWEQFRWNVWKDCGYNPIYPQGGTWPFDRAGWCPGTMVDEYNFELTGKVFPGDTMLIDYGIEMYKDNGEKDGEFRMSHQLVSYGPPNFKNDARIEDIIVPSSKDSYSRINPICSNPRIIIRNTGEYILKSLDIIYGLKSGVKKKYIWGGELGFMESEEVWLPVPDWSNLENDSVFIVEISNPNGAGDEYTPNNKMTSVVKIPDLMPDEFVIYVETNDKGRAKENSWFVSDALGGVLYSREVFQDSVTYRDTVNLSKGYYEFRLTDSMEDGMNRHWWSRNSDPELVGRNGKIEFRSVEGEVIRSFPYDFGQELLFRFRVK